MDDWAFNTDYAQRLLLEHFNLASLDGLGAAGQSLSVCAAGALIHYLRDSQLASLGKVATLRFFEPSDFMKLDASTIANLELVRTLDGSPKGSLLSFLDQTRTGMGARLLKSWLLLPLLDLGELERRQSVGAGPDGQRPGAWPAGAASWQKFTTSSDSSAASWSESQARASFLRCVIRCASSLPSALLLQELSARAHVRNPRTAG